MQRENVQTNPKHKGIFDVYQTILNSTLAWNLICKVQMMESVSVKETRVGRSLLSLDPSDDPANLFGDPSSEACSMLLVSQRQTCKI